MNISEEEVNLIKQKTAKYLTKSIYKLCYILGEDPEDVMAASSLENLISDEISQMQKDALISLFNQVTALKKLN